MAPGFLSLSGGLEKGGRAGEVGPLTEPDRLDQARPVAAPYFKNLSLMYSWGVGRGPPYSVHIPNP